MSGIPYQDEGTNQERDLQIVSLELLTPTACRGGACAVPHRFNLSYTFLSGVAREKKLPSKKPLHHPSSSKSGKFDPAGLVLDHVTDRLLRSPSDPSSDAGPVESEKKLPPVILRVGVSPGKRNILGAVEC